MELLDYAPFRNLNPRAPVDEDAKKCIPLGPITIYECNFYLRTNGRATAFNAFLDGTMFHGGHSVDRDPFYYDLAAGFTLRFKHVALNYEFVRRSREFSPVPPTASNRDGHHDYGAIRIDCLDNMNWACPAFFVGLLGTLFMQ